MTHNVTRFLAAGGIGPTSVSFGCDTDTVGSIPEQAYLDAARRAKKIGRGTQAVFVSPRLRALNVIEVEAQTGLPVVTSNQGAFLAQLKLSAWKTPVLGFA
jgi:maleate isomerase